MGGGVAWDLASGNYFWLNESAARVAKVLLTGDATDAAAAVALAFGLDEPGASRLVTSVLESLTPAAALSPLPGDDFPYRRHGGGFALFYKDRPLLEVDEGVHEVRWRQDVPCPLPLAFTLRLLSPKALQARGALILHAAACARADGLTILGGASGAGKSTTARTLGEIEDRRPVCDDLVVVDEPSLATSQPLARIEAEAAIYRWCDDAAEAFRRDPRSSVALAGLTAAAGTGATLPLARIFVLSAERRRGSVIERRRVQVDEALVQLLSMVFLGGDDRTTVSGYLSGCARLAAAIPLFSVTVPEGIDRLREAFRSDLEHDVE